MKNYNIELITWSDSFACGIAIIDDQHRGLIGLINNMLLHSTGNEEMERPYFYIVIDEVIECIKFHLATEEKFLNATKFPGYTQHKRAHKSFLMTLIDAAEDYKMGRRHTLGTISNYLKNWALSHMAILDKAYFDYFRKIAIRNPDGKLTITLEDYASKKAVVKHTTA